MTIKETIKSLDFFKLLDEYELDNLSKISTIDTYNKNYIFSYEKSQTNKLIFLVDGLAKSYKIDKHGNEIFLYHIHKNSMLSDIENIDDDTIYYFSNIVFLEETTILSIDYKLFKKSVNYI